MSARSAVADGRAAPPVRGTFRSRVLTGVSALASDDVWAVGSDFLHVNGGGHRITLAEHWDGAAWAKVVTPNYSHGDNSLLAVAGLNSDDVWAVGSGSSRHQGSWLPVVIHWDGSTWARVDVPVPPGCTLCGLSSVTAVAADDVWAAGYGSPHPWLEHWDGTAWSLVAGPRAPEPLFQSDLSATSAADLWLVAELDGNHPFTAHWDGTAWSRVRVNAPAAGALYGVFAIAPNDVWAVGAYAGTIVLHWDGTRWREVDAPSPGTSSSLNDVSGTSADDLWAVGRTNESGKLHSLVEHWDGSGWTRVDSPNPVHKSYLFAVGATGADDAWTVGGPGQGSAFTEHWDGQTWVTVPIH